MNDEIAILKNKCTALFVAMKKREAVLLDARNKFEQAEREWNRACRQLMIAKMPNIVQMEDEVAALKSHLAHAERMLADEVSTYQLNLQI